METIIPDGYYQYDPSTGQITLLSPYNSITKAQVKYIYNLSQRQLLYDCRNSPPEQYITVETVEGNVVITHRYGMDEHTENDVLQINVDMFSENNTLVTLFDAQSVDPSETIRSTEPVPTIRLSKLLCYVSNSGTSANVTINIYASPTNSTTGMAKTLATFTLGAGTAETPYKTGNGIDPKQLDNYIWGEIINGDTENPAITTVEFSMFR